MRLYVENESGARRDSITLPIADTEYDGLYNRLSAKFTDADCIAVDCVGDFIVGAALHDFETLNNTARRIARLNAYEYAALLDFCVEFELQFEDIGGLFDYVNQVMRKRREYNV